MSRIIINGNKTLEGEIFVSGAKNAALPLMAASILADEDVVLYNVPHLNDVETMRKVLKSLGFESMWLSENTLKILRSTNIKEEAPYELVKAMRASFFVMGPLLARLKKAKVPLPGGCAIGVRPVNIHLKGFELLGAKVSIDSGCAVAVADKLVGTSIHLDFPSVGATENLMMAATLAEGTTVIENAAQEPEIVDLADFLNNLGAKIKGAGSPTIVIEGVAKLKGGEYKIIPDRIEAGTFAILGCLIGSPLVIKNAQPNHLTAVLAKLQEMGANIKVAQNEIITDIAESKLKGTEVKTLPYPGFPTDLQAQIMVAMCVASGASIITETVFENRFMHVAELVRMGANLNIRDRTVFITGVNKLIGCPVSATDLRAGAALVIAGLIADGVTEVGNVYHIERGYENLVQKLAKVGANIYLEQTTANNSINSK